MIVDFDDYLGGGPKPEADPVDAKPAEMDPLRAFEIALREARAATHERKLEAPVARAFASIIEALDKARDAFRAHERRAKAIEGRFCGDT